MNCMLWVSCMTGFKKFFWIRSVKEIHTEITSSHIWHWWNLLFLLLFETVVDPFDSFDVFFHYLNWSELDIDLFIFICIFISQQHPEQDGTLWFCSQLIIFKWKKSWVTQNYLNFKIKSLIENISLESKKHAKWKKIHNFNETNKTQINFFKKYINLFYLKFPAL